jgi:hypothetical protein
MHAGYLSTNCGSCHKQEPDVRQALGCVPDIAANQPAWKLYEEERVVNYLNCPMMFIPKWVWYFWEVYRGYQRNRYSIPSFFEQPRKYAMACDAYESALGRFQIIKARDDEAQAQRKSLSRFT